MHYIHALLAAIVLLLPLPAASVQAPLAARDSAAHALNRLAYGATPREIDSIAHTGVIRWIDRQLEAKPGHDHALDVPERGFSILSIDPEDLARGYAEAQREARAEKRAAAPDSASRADGKEADRGSRRRLAHLGEQLQQLVVVRAALADQQLFEIMADFWTNHFNVFYGKNLDRAYLAGYIERTIRRHALGRFEDLLIATAESPAMLIYLDNALSVAPGSTPPRADRRGPAARTRGGFRKPLGGRRMGRAARDPRPNDRGRMDSRGGAARARQSLGLNENYARELMELHTLGVDGGYTQLDVVEVARILTGWGVERPLEGGAFEFHDWAHDRGAKVVLGTRFPAGKGRDEGVQLLKLLANHPSTMHFVSAKLCARFVNDIPPDGCVDDAVRTWQRTRGDIREILRAIFHGPDFWAPVNVGAKIKTPLEFLVSAARAAGGVPDTVPDLARRVRDLGQPLYFQAAPTGYPESQAEWVSSGGLLARMNLAVALASGRLGGLAIALDRITPPTPDQDQLVEAINRAVLGGRMTANTRTVIHREIAGLTDLVKARAMAVGLALGSPEFQRQ